MRARLRYFFLLLTCVLVCPISAQQIYGVITDAETGDSIPFASVVYKGHQQAVVSDVSGKYRIDRHEGWNITFSAVGYKSRIMAITNKTKSRLNIKLKPSIRSSHPFPTRALASTVITLRTR